MTKNVPLTIESEHIGSMKLFVDVSYLTKTVKDIAVILL